MPKIRDHEVRKTKGLIHHTFFSKAQRPSRKRSRKTVRIRDVQSTRTQQGRLHIGTHTIITACTRPIQAQEPNKIRAWMAGGVQKLPPLTQELLTASGRGKREEGDLLSLMM